jgi:hypothetical protein
MQELLSSCATDYVHENLSDFRGNNWDKTFQPILFLLNKNEKNGLAIQIILDWDLQMNSNNMYARNRKDKTIARVMN